MSSNEHTIHGLREHLFATIEALRAGQIKPDQARVVNELAQTVVNSAKVEVDYLRATKRQQSHFLTSAPPSPPADTGKSASQLPNGIVGIRRHILKDED